MPTTIYKRRNHGMTSSVTPKAKSRPAAPAKAPKDAAGDEQDYSDFTTPELRDFAKEKGVRGVKAKTRSRRISLLKKG